MSILKCEENYILKCDKKYLDFDQKKLYNNKGYTAEIAQLVEHFTRNEGVVGSSPIFSLTHLLLFVVELFFLM